jgi:hypothetical protein
MADIRDNKLEDYSSDEGDNGFDVMTKNSVQQALNRAREHRDTNLIDQRTGTRGSHTQLQSSKRSQVFYDPRNDDDARSVATTTTTVSMAGEYRDEHGRPMTVVAIPKGAKIKTVDEMDDDDDGNDFPPLDYEKIQVNLGLLGDLDQDEKLHISLDGTRMYVDGRFFNTARRWYSGDSRTKTLRFIKHLYCETEKLCESIVDHVKANDYPKENTEKLMNLYGLIQGSSRGLDRLNITYADDKWCLSEIRTIKKGYEAYCDRTLKETINGFRKNFVE